MSAQVSKREAATIARERILGVAERLIAERGAAVVKAIADAGKGSARFYQADFASLADVRRLATHPMVAQVIPISLGDSYRGYRIVGTEHAMARTGGNHQADQRAQRGEFAVGQR